MSKKKYKSDRLIRNIILIVFFVLFSIFSLRHYILGGGVAASVDALCPFGGFETLYTFILTGGLVSRITISSLILGFGVALSVLILRKGFCGYICPFGALQDFLFKLNKTIKISKKMDERGRYLKYIVLIVILVGTAYTGTLVFKDYDPFRIFFHFGKGLFWDVEAEEYLIHFIGFSVTLTVLGLAIFVNRFFCKYLCPFGATMNLFSKIGLTKVTRNSTTCTSCGICDRKCPMNVNVSTVKYVKSVECINCNNCVSACPQNSLQICAFKKKNISPNIYGLLSIFILFFVGISMFLGVWESVPVLKESDILLPDAIKGWMTLQDVSDATGIEIDKLGSDLNVSQKYYNMPMKEVKNYVIGFETEIVRDYVEKYNQKAQSIGH